MFKIKMLEDYRCCDMCPVLKAGHYYHIVKDDGYVIRVDVPDHAIDELDYTDLTADDSCFTRVGVEIELADNEVGFCRVTEACL